MVSCSAYGCKNRTGTGKKISFHRFPLQNNDLLKKWVVALKRQNFVPQKTSCICSDHFLARDYVDGVKETFRPRLLNSAVPSVFSFPPHLIRAVKVRPGHKRRAETSVNCDLLEDLPSTSELQCEETEATRPKVAHAESSVAVSPVRVKFQPHKKCSPTKLKLRKKVKLLQQNIRRKRKKIKTLEDVIAILKQKEFLNSEASDNILRNFSGISRSIVDSELKNKGHAPKGRRYSDEIKKFALTLHFYSPRAYEYVRSIFCLPAQSSLCNWTSSVNCNPGFFKDVFEFLQQKASEDKSYKDCALICDAMHIMSRTPFNKSTGRYEGFVDYGEGVLAFDCEKVATEALMFMLVGLRGHWKCPVGYVLCDKINASDLSALISKALSLAATHNLNIRTVTCDGTSVNFEAMKHLGCNIGHCVNDVNGTFKHPSSGADVYFIPDACHMLKLARNALSDLSIIIDDNGQQVRWNYITKLHEIQLQEGLKFANKLSNYHVQFHRHKMNVKVAAQTLSSSVADAIEFLKSSHHPFFKDAGGTIKFIRILDQLFDFLNSRNPYGKGFKKPLQKHDISRWESVFSHASGYLSKLTDKEGTPLMQHRRRTFVVGFMLAAQSAKRVSHFLLTRVNDPFKYVLTYKMSQDHLELLFACIRGKNGFNNNPDVIQLKSSLKRILLRNAIRSSNQANCVAFENESAGSIFSLKWR